MLVTFRIDNSITNMYRLCFDIAVYYNKIFVFNKYQKRSVAICMTTLGINIFFSNFMAAVLPVKEI